MPEILCHIFISNWRTHSEGRSVCARGINEKIFHFSSTTIWKRWLGLCPIFPTQFFKSNRVRVQSFDRPMPETCRRNFYNPRENKLKLLSPRLPTKFFLIPTRTRWKARSVYSRCLVKNVWMFLENTFKLVFGLCSKIRKKILLFTR